MTKIAKLINTLQIKLNLSDDELGDILDVHRMSIWNYKHNRRFPNGNVIIQLANLAKKNKIKVNLEDLLE